MAQKTQTRRPGGPDSLIHDEWDVIEVMGGSPEIPLSQSAPPSTTTSHPRLNRPQVVLPPEMVTTEAEEAEAPAEVTEAQGNTRLTVEEALALRSERKDVSKEVKEYVEQLDNVQQEKLKRNLLLFYSPLFFLILDGYSWHDSVAGILYTILVVIFRVAQTRGNEKQQERIEENIREFQERVKEIDSDLEGFVFPDETGLALVEEDPNAGALTLESGTKGALTDAGPVPVKKTL